MASKYIINAILFQEGEWWSAQCLQYDIATQARTLPELCSELERVLIGHVVVSTELGLQPFEGLPPAPPKYWNMFVKSKLKVQRDPDPFRIPLNMTSPLPMPEVKIAEPDLQPA